ncbi:MAG TPA: sigma-70 family RNA polymerase sigma factor [Gemmataceae bacterium]|nr:sigma-70 family RNA polymerase sigma factor [Gemmataceae bacterium]
MGDQTSLLQGLLARMLQGEEGARRELINCAYQRVRCLAAVILNESFPRLKKPPALVDTTDLANEASVKLFEALADVRPETVTDFFRLAAQRMRWLLLDLARRVDRSEEHRQQAATPPCVESNSSMTGMPTTLAALYQQIEELPEKEREVVDLLYFHGLSQPEAAAILGVTERTVRRYWTVAKVKLFEGLKDFLPTTDSSQAPDRAKQHAERDRP